jgi:hypothetical protein
MAGKQEENGLGGNGMECDETTRRDTHTERECVCGKREKESGKTGGKNNIFFHAPPFSIPLTAASATFRSTFLATSLTGSSTESGRGVVLKNARPVKLRVAVAAAAEREDEDEGRSRRRARDIVVFFFGRGDLWVFGLDRAKVLKVWSRLEWRDRRRRMRFVELDELDGVEKKL